MRDPKTDDLRIVINLDFDIEADGVSTEGDEDLIDPMWCEIEYVDGQGELHSREVILQMIERRKRYPSIVASLADDEEKVRSFRIDRIQSITTEHGEIYEGTSFLTEVLGLNISPRKLLRAQPTQEGATQRPKKNPPWAPPQPGTATLMDCIESPLLVLVACAMIDGSFDEAELSCIRAWAESEARFLHLSGIIPETSAPEFAYIFRRIDAMRPAINERQRHMAITAQMTAEAITRFCAALREVANAGSGHPDKLSLVSDFDILRQNPYMLRKLLT
jgi:hypothetical protein